MKLVRIVIVLLMVIAFSSQALAQTSITPSPSPGFKIGYIKDSDIATGCRLSLNPADLRQRRYVYVQGMDEPAYINLDGRNLELRLVKFSNTTPEKVGDRSWERYVAGDVKVRIDWTVTRGCDPDDESCETTYFKAVITISRKTQRAIVNAVGFCGG